MLTFSKALSRALAAAASIVSVVPASAFQAASSPARAITVDDIEHILDVNNPRVSPDGKWIAYTVRHVDTKADKNITNLWMVSSDGTQDIPLTYETDAYVRERRWRR